MDKAEKDKDRYHEGLENIGTIDGRECLFTGKIANHLSEGALHRNRAYFQIENLIALSKTDLPGFPKISEEEILTLRKIVAEDPLAATCRIADYDHFGTETTKPFEHDVKSVEVYLREMFDKYDLGHLKEFIHFPFTSEDLNNLSWNYGFRDAINTSWLPGMMNMCDKLAHFAVEYANVPVLGKTHCMNASPTTFGKRIAYFLGHFTNVLNQLQTLQLSAKYSGPVGNHNAMTAAVPDFDFPAYAKSFVEKFGFRYEPCENQRNSHIEIVRVLNEISMINTFAVDLCENILLNVAMGWIDLIPKEGQIGSSVMPHKINPWFFECAKGYLKQSSSLIKDAQGELIQSWFERGLTDHPYERAYGEMLAKSLIGINYVAAGFDTLKVNDEKALRELQTTPEILTELVQIVGRLHGVPDVYMKIKNLSRGQSLDLQTLHKIIDEIIPDEATRVQLKAVKPETYIGIAPELTHQVVHNYSELSWSLVHGILDPFAGIHAVLSDFDGVLHFGDKEELTARISKIVENLGMQISADDIAAVCKQSDYEKMKQDLVQKHNIASSQVVTLEMFQEENLKISGTFDHHLVRAEGAHQFFQNLLQLSYKTGLVTTRGSNSLPRLLEKHGYQNLFDVVIDRHAKADNTLRVKPHPEPIVLALKHLEISPRRAMFIGDKQTDDIIAGKALGMKTILICKEPLDEYGAIPDYHFKTFKEFAEFFERVKGYGI